jgi:serine O-acetyltransferase
MSANFKYDLRRYNIFLESRVESLFSIVNNFVFAYGLHAIAVYRFGRWIDAKIKSPVAAPLKGALLLIYHLFAWMVRKAYDIHISKKTEIGPGLYIGHFGGIEVEGGCTIGSNCSISQHTKILVDKNSGKPSQVGSKVWIGAYAVIEGCDIGDGATIAAGACVGKNIDCCNLAAGNPARVVSKNYNNQEILGTIL